MLRFGTDGVRGDADADLTSPLVVALGRAAARVLRADAAEARTAQRGSHTYGTERFFVGRDTRPSGERIERDLAAGLALEGAQVVSLGVVPTPETAYVAQRENAPAAVISASHNVWTDNGVKLLAAGGKKLTDDVEQAIERELESLVADTTTPPVPTYEKADRTDDYLAHLLGALDGRRLNGLAVVLDCANGAAYKVGPKLFRDAGAQVTVLHALHDGRSINDQCGSTYPQSLQEKVRANGADIGLALDGDADRVIAIDETGEIVDGDQIMTALALDMHERGGLPNNAIAVTVMSNLGLRRALAAAGIGIVETAVGDRNVLVALAEHGLALGGEQSGHVILPQLATTGDGLLTGLLLCDLAVRRGVRASALAARMHRLPQVLDNVRVQSKPDLSTAADLAREIATVERELGDSGRVLVRTSGTEPLVRVMVEAETAELAAATAARLRKAVEKAYPADQNS
ncbi:MAG: phosphoglucosamine mutase [Actinomycetota bacterium]|nr:phosphoglucosamine mutase [Actinomycetota bacterium]